MNFQVDFQDGIKEIMQYDSTSALSLVKYPKIPLKLQQMN